MIVEDCGDVVSEHEGLTGEVHRLDHLSYTDVKFIDLVISFSVIQDEIDLALSDGGLIRLVVHPLVVVANKLDTQIELVDRNSDQISDEREDIHDSGGQNSNDQSVDDDEVYRQAASNISDDRINLGV